MTHPEMAEELTKAGWRVDLPLTTQDCKHPRIQGSVTFGSDGSSRFDWCCLDCGYRGRQRHRKPISMELKPDEVVAAHNAAHK